MLFIQSDYFNSKQSVSREKFLVCNLSRYKATFFFTYYLLYFLLLLSSYLHFSFHIPKENIFLELRCRYTKYKSNFKRVVN